MTESPYLVISDLQIPFENPRALEFCTYLKRHYKIPDSHCINIGDEVDISMGSVYPKNPNGDFSPKTELKESKEILKKWYEAFPEMKVCISNHGLRWVKKAIAAEIPEQVIRSYREIIAAPQGWVWRYEWIIPTKHPFKAIHGMDYSGVNATRNMVYDYGISTVHGHLHSGAQIVYVRTGNEQGLKCWGFNVGCLIDIKSYNFEYERKNRQKPVLGAGLIFESGRIPMFIPLE